MLIGRAYFDFVTPTALKYIARVYTIVSDEPIIIEQHLPIKLSGPFSMYMLFVSAVAELDEIGLVIIIGISSFDMPNLSVKVPKQLHITSNAPLTVNIFTAHTKIISVGSIFIDVEKPSLQPFINSSNRFFFDIKIVNAAAKIMIGIE